MRQRRLQDPDLPKCEECKTGTNVHVVSTYTLLGVLDRYRWLCGDCEYKLTIDAFPAPTTKLPREMRARPLQREKLFDVPVAPEPRKGEPQ